MKAGWLLVALLVAGAGAALLLADRQHQDDARDQQPLVQSVLAEPPAVSPPALGVVQPLSAAPNLPPPAELDAGLAQRAALAGAVAARFTGRVVEVDGTPVAGATVTLMPGTDTLRALGIDALKPAWPEGAIARWSVATTAGDGSFVLQDYHVPGVPHRTGLLDHDLDPTLVVAREGRATYAHACLGFRGGEYDAGTLTLEPEAIVVGRLVDERLEPIPGYILTAESRAPASMVERRAPGFEPDHPLSATSDGEGRFELRGVWPGKVFFTVFDSEHQYRGFPAFRDCGEGRFDLGDIGIARNTGVRVAGRVLDGSGQPVAAAEVLAVNRGVPSFVLSIGADTLWDGLRMHSEARTLTDASGGFTLELVPRQPKRLHVRAPGHAITSIDTDVDRDRVGDIVLPALGEWRVHVTGPAEALERARLTAVAHLDESRLTDDPEWMANMPPENRPGGAVNDPGVAVPVERVAEGAAGGWRIAGAGNACTELLVEADGMGAVVQRLEGLAPGQTQERTLALEPESVISGQVIDAEGAPVKGAVVVVAPADPHLAQHFHWDVRTAADGSYRSAGLGRGEWSVRASAPRFADSEPQTLTVRAPASPLDASFTLQRAASLRGLVLDVDDQPVPGCPVWVAPRPAGPEGQAFDPMAESLVVRTDTGGAFAFDSLPAGAYTIRTESTDTLEAVLVSGAPREVTLHRRRPPVVRGRVLSGGEPLAGAGLYPYPGGGAFWDLTDADGQYEFALPEAGEYELDVFPPAGPAPAFDAFSVDARWGEVATVDMELGGGRVRGEVVDADSGAPLAGVRAILVGEGRTDGVSTHTDEAGHFDFRPVPDGRYQVVARGGAHAESRSASLEVTGGAKVDGVRVETPPGRCSLTVNVLDPWGQPAKGDLYLFAQRGEQRIEAVKGTPGLFVFFRYEPGVFVFEELEPGAYELSLEQPGPTRPDPNPTVIATEHVELAPGEVRSLEIRLATAP